MKFENNYKIKILFLAMAFAPHWRHGGPPRIMHTYFKSLDGNEDFDIRVFAAYEDIDVEFEINKKIKYFRNSGVLKSYYYGISFIKLLKEINALDVGGRVIIHLSQTRSIFNFLALLLSYSNKIKVVISPFGSLPQRSYGVKNIYDYFITRPLIRRSSLGLGQTDHELELLRNWGCKNVKLGLLTINKDYLIQRYYSIKNENIVKFIYLGRFHKTKNVTGLVESFSKFNALNKKWTLTLIGHGDDIEKIKEMISSCGLSDKIFVLGPVYDESRFELYRDFDFYIINSNIYEETSLASVEAISVGLPVIVNRMVDLPYLEEYDAGFVVKDPTNLVDVLIRAVNLTTESRSKMRSNALSLFKDRYSPRSVVDQLIKYYTEIYDAEN